MKKTVFIFGLALMLVLSITSCGSKSSSESSNNVEKESAKSLAEGASGDIKAYENGDVNAVEQARPTIMVIPGDQTLKQFDCLNNKTVDGVRYTERDYELYLQKDDRARRITSFIQNKFNAQNYPLNDFEQTVKDLDTQHATDMADNLEQDSKALLLMTARPDIILEMEYIKTSSLTSHDYKNKNVSYTLSAIDAYSKKVVATISTNNIKGTSVTEAIQDDLEGKLPQLMNDIQKYFSDILTRGRDITVRINVEKDSNVKLTDESIEGDTYTDWIVDFMKSHTVKGAYKMTRNTKTDLYFQNCRIKLLNEDGSQYGVYDFTRDLQKYLRKNLRLNSSNQSQGLGEVVLTVTGI